MTDKKLFFVTIILIMIIFIYGIFMFIHPFSYPLQDSNKEIIYNVVDYDNKKVPYVNLKGGDSNIINESIQLFVKDDLDNDSDISYKYNKYGNILSLLVRITKTNSSNAPMIQFQSYNIIISNVKLLENHELLSIMNTNDNYVNQIVTNHFMNYYNNSEIKSFLDYDDYVQYREHYFNIPNDIHYYIDDNKLYAYLNINNGIDYSEYAYLKQSEYRIVVGDYHE